MDLDAEENASVNRVTSLEKDEVIEPILVSLDDFTTSVQGRVYQQCITDVQCVFGSGWIWMRPCDDVALFFD